MAAADEVAEEPLKIVGPWVWEGNELFDATRTVVASVRSDVIFFGPQRLLVEYEPGPIQFRARATTGDGRVFTVNQAGMTVGILNANCAGREYTLRRTSVWRKQRQIVDAGGTAIATIRPLISGRVFVHFLGEDDGDAALDPIDAVFLSWGCVLVDSPVRRPRV